MISRALSAAFRGPKSIPYAYGVIHAVIDASTVTVVVSASMIHELTLGQAFQLIVAYDILAFGSQALIGLIIDKLELLRGAVLLGIALTVGAVVALPLEPVTAMILGGFGNASFHVGAGAITLCASEGRSAPNGIFVAPGALGLTFGLWFGRSGVDLIWPFYVALGVSFVWTLLLPVPEEHRVRTPPERDRAPGAPEPGRVRFAHVIVALLLVSIVVRSLVGYSGAHECPSGPLKLFGLGAVAFGGKALGGIVSDRLGWMEVSVGALLLSAPFIAFGGPNIEILLIGMFLFQMTMPVTLAAVALCYPRRPGLAFGLTCLALIIGVLPTFSQAATQFYGPGVFLGLISLSAASVFFGLRMLGDRNPIRGLLSQRQV